MQAADITILVILSTPALVGVMYGFLNIVFSLLAWVLASGIAVKATPLLAPMFESQVETPLIRSVLVFAAIFIVSLMILSALGYFIVKLLGRAGLTAADRILGLLFGFGLGLTIVGVVIFLAGFTAFPKESWWENSRLVRPFENVAVWGQQYLPESLVKHHGYEFDQTPATAPGAPSAPAGAPPQPEANT